MRLVGWKRPDIVVDALTEHRRAQLEERMALGLGKLPEDALVFSSLDGRPRSPRNLSGDWAEVVGTLGIEPVTFHALRHTHASQLIDAGALGRGSRNLLQNRRHLRAGAPHKALSQGMR